MPGVRVYRVWYAIVAAGAGTEHGIGTSHCLVADVSRRYQGAYENLVPRLPSCDNKNAGHGAGLSSIRGGRVELMSRLAGVVYLKL